jgi:hypothetical protein
MVKQVILFLAGLTLSATAGYYFPLELISVGTKAEKNGRPAPPSPGPATTREIKTTVNLRPADATQASSKSDYIGELENLLQQKSSADPRQWSEARDQLYRSMRSDVGPEALAALARWEDPTGEVRRKLYKLGQRERGSLFYSKEFNSLPSTESACLWLAEMNVTGNWAETAQTYSSVSIDPATHAQMLDVFVGTWLKNAPPAEAVSWLATHAGDPRYDRARITASAASQQATLVLSSQMSDPENAQLAKLLGKAFGH